MSAATDVQPTPDPRGHQDSTEGDEREVAVMAMLQEHVPLSLIVDLTDPTGPESSEILALEGAPETRWWES